MTSSAHPYPWRLFWLLLLMTILSIVAAIPAILDLVAGVLAKIELPNAPIPLLVLVGAIQNLSLLALMIWVGLKLAPRVGLGVPLFESWTRGEAVPSSAIRRSVTSGLLNGIFVGIVLLICLLVLAPRLPDLPFVRAAQLPIWKRFLLCFYGGVYEEVLTRLFLLTLVAWIANRSWQKARGTLSSPAFWFANVFAALLFGLGHLPSASLFMQITPLVVVAAIILNGIAGIAFGYLYRRNGLESAMVAHLTADFVLYVLGPFLLPLVLLPSQAI